MKEIRLSDETELTHKDLAALEDNSPRAIILLSKKKLNPEDIPEKLWFLHDQPGSSVLDLCIERFKEPVSDGNGRIVPRALFLASKPRCGLPLHFRKVREILSIVNEDGWSVAHELASKKKLVTETMTEEILKLTDVFGCAVAYCAVEKNLLPDWAKKRRDILMLGNGKGDYVAHELARLGHLPSESMTEEILKLKNQGKCSVAYKAAWYDSFPEWAKSNKDILLLGNGKGNYVAHVLAMRGKLPVKMMTEEILKLTTRKKCTVAYYVINWSSLPDWAKRRKDILLLGNGKGDYVAHELARCGNLPVEMMTEEILKLQNRDGCFVAYHAARWNLLPDWAKRRRDILLLGNGKRDYVAHALARSGDLLVEMMTPDILKLEDIYKQTVLFALVSERHLSPEILLLPWEKNTRVFEYLLSENFQKQKPDEKDMIYVKEQFATLEVLLQKKSIAELSVRQNHDCDYQKEIER